MTTASKIKNGFTLIELLVVIAIIGILASMSIYVLNEAKQSAKDAAIKTAVLEGVKKAEIFYDNYGDYDGLCDEPEFQTGGLLNDNISNNGGSFVCGDGADGYCMSSTLNSGDQVCVDHYREIKNGFVCSSADDIVCD